MPLTVPSKITGRTFSELVQSWILNPLNMKSSYFNPPVNILDVIPPTEIDNLFFTHHHSDHDLDYPAFLLTRWETSLGLEKDLGGSKVLRWSGIFKATGIKTLE